jgi:membrane protein YdbS with pleckstrin-like domain
MTDSTPAAAAPAAAPAPDFQPLDPRALRLWQVSVAMAYLVLLALLLVGGLLLMWLRPSLAAPVMAVWLFFVALAVWTILCYHPRNYRAWGYHLDRRVLLIKKGVWFRSIKLLPLPRLQHVDVKRGPLQRHFGLATLVMHTAGTHAASIEVPGLDADEALRLRDRLVAAGGDDGV